jgi:cytochrome P450
MTETVSTDTAFRYPQQRTCPYQPPEGYARLRAEGPLVRVTLYDGATAWLVTRHADARTLLNDPRLSSDRSREGFPIVTPRLLEVRHFRTLVTMDAPEHTRYRRMLMPYFIPKRTRELRPDVERVVHESIDALLAMEPPVDLIEGFAGPLAGKVIFHLLGVPEGDQVFFQKACVRLLLAGTAEEGENALAELVTYLDELVTSRRGESGTWLLDRLVADEGGLSWDDLVRMAVQMLVTGQGSTAQMIALSAATLLEHPEQLDEMRRDPALVPSAVEELLRYLTIADMAGIRVATADIDLHGQVIAAGEGVIMPYALVDRDPDAYPDPDRLDIHRTMGNPHFAFGFGPHNCVAQGLARLELEVTLAALFERVPALRLAVPMGELRVRSAADMQGVYELPVTWT